MHVGWRVLVVVWAVLVTGIAGGCTDAPARPSAARPDLSASLVQQRPDEGTRRAQVRLTNGAESTVRVTGVGLSWPGYGGVRTFPADTEYAPGRTIDLPVELPEAVCDAPTEPPAAVVEVDGERHTVPLDDAGVRALRQIWEHDCALVRVERAASIMFGPRWHRVGHTLHGTVEVVRRSPGAEVAVMETSGSVLLDLTPVRTGRPIASLAPGWSSVSVPVVLGSNGRCDPHALGGSTQTFLLRVGVSVDGAEPVQVVLVPDPATQDRVLRLVTSACGAG